MKCAYCGLSGIIEKGHCANCRYVYKDHPMITQGFDRVAVTKSRSSFGNWAVKYSPSSIRFFWLRVDAEQWAEAYNRTAQPILNTKEAS